MSKHFKKDFMASIVVFLVAIPLCMGIAVASNVPIQYGILSGIIGGLVVGFITGSPLQVSGPAAGLVVLVLNVVDQYGLVGLGFVTFFAGLIQILFYFFKAGPYFRAISPAVINGMLSGIGVIIFASQFHVMLDDKPVGKPFENLMTIPQAILKIFDTNLGIPHMEAAFIGALSILTIVLWNVVKDKHKLLLPGTLIGVLVATALTYFAKLPINKINPGENFLNVFTDTVIFNNFGSLTLDLFLMAIPMAFIATAETLLCTNAVEKMRPDVTVDYNKELLAQGIGNTLSGIFCALPMTGVIVRSSANVESGGETKTSTILHGLWLLLFITLMSGVLKLIPMAALAAILVYTGAKLLNIKGMIQQFKVDKSEFAIWVITTIMIISTDLLKGILFGFALSLIKLLFHVHKLDMVKADEDGNHTTIKLKGKASFLNLPTIAKFIEHESKSKKSIHIQLNDLMYQDDAFNDYIENIITKLKSKGISVVVKEG